MRMKGEIIMMKRTILFVATLFSILNLQCISYATDEITVAVSEEKITTPQKYEIWNNGEDSGISSLMECYEIDNIEPTLYINIKDISMLGLEVEDIIGGIGISNNVKKVKILFDAEVLNIDMYSFETPIIKIPDGCFLKLDIIGKCFSDEYSGRMVDDVWRIYLSVNSVSGNTTPSLVVQSTIFNFEHNIYTIQIKNNSYNKADSVNIYTTYYSKDGKLLDLKLNNIYVMDAKSELTTFIPISNNFNTAAKCKIMFWNDNMNPIGEVTTIKDFIYDKSIVVPENKEMIFSDIPTNHKYYDAIYILYNQEFLNGYEDGTFKPDECILKSEFAYLLTNMTGVQSDKINVDCNLKDVPSSHWCKTPIGYLVSNNIMDTENEYFYPNNNITLNEVLAAFLRMLGEKDVTINTITTLANQHQLLINANTDEAEITRGNFVQIAYNFMNEYCK